MSYSDDTSSSNSSFNPEFWYVLTDFQWFAHIPFPSQADPNVHRKCVMYHNIYIIIIYSYLRHFLWDDLDVITCWFPLYSYLLDEMDRIRIWNRRRLSPLTVNLRLRCKDTVPKAISSCHLWRTVNLPGILRHRSFAIQYTILEAVHIQGQGTCNKYGWLTCETFFSCYTLYLQRDERISKSYTRSVVTGDEWFTRNSPSTWSRSGWRKSDDAATHQSYWSTYSTCHIQSYTKVHHILYIWKRTKYIYIYNSIKLGKMSSNRNVNIFTLRKTKITKLFFLIECLYLVGS